MLEFRDTGGFCDSCALYVTPCFRCLQTCPPSASKVACFSLLKTEGLNGFAKLALGNSRVSGGPVMVVHDEEPVGGAGNRNR
jgi:hypothetical protein